MNRLLKRSLATILSATILISAAPVMAENNDESDGQISLMSLLPIEEKEAALVLNGYTEDEINAMPLSVVLSKLQDKDGNYITIPESASVLWAHFKDDEGNVIRDEYHEIGRNETVDLSEFSYTTGYTMELIVGSGHQLDMGNIRYIVRVYISDEVSENLELEYYIKKPRETLRKLLYTDYMTETYLPREGYSKEQLVKSNMIELAEAYEEGDDIRLNISSLKSKHPDYTLLIQDGDTEEFITDQVLNKTMTNVTDGISLLGVDYTQSHKTLYVYYIYKGRVESCTTVTITLSTGLIRLQGVLSTEKADVVYSTKQSSEQYIKDSSTNEIIGANITFVTTYMLNEGYPADAEYYYKANYGTSTSIRNHLIDKIVVGDFDSIEETSDEPDIKNQILGDNAEGYKANFSDNGITFTVFFDGGYAKQKIIATDYQKEYIPDFDNAPIIGQSDPYFRITGLKQGNNKLDSYIIENGGKYNLDTYYGFGYQTVLINDKNADLSKITPEFWPSSEISDDILDVFEGTSGGGSKQESGKIEKDFSNGALQYSAVWKDDSNKVRNYQVSVVKKVTGPKLYVNGPDKLEIFLDDYFEQKHDIFIANIGDEELKNLKVELIDAKNVKLDDYWTVGGDNNNTLAAFTITSTSSDYSELPNVAKIRLLPDGDKTGEISGTLKITSNGGEKEIELTGQAGNPDIVTKELTGAVKYVPYQRLVMTNNMHEWNDVSFELVSGKLPNGVTLYPNGEIYGVPTETGKFNIKVRANYSRDTFESSEVELSLTVKDNTDENVEAETDVAEGYGFKTRFPNKVTGEKAEVFEIEHDYDENEFQGVWIDGKKLVKDVDYTVEKGSTKITVSSQTISNTSNGSHTIAAEYRNSNNEVKKSAQNYTKTTTASSNKSSGAGGSSTPSTYKVWLEVNGGAWLQELTIKRNTTIADLPTPKRSGYAFGGWYTDEALTQPFDVNTKINKTTVLYAKWIDIYTIWFVENGGEEVADVTVQYGNPTPTLPTPIKTGYIFDGWYSDEALTQPFGSSDEITASMSLYAKWRADVAPDNVLGFDDINATDWFYNDVDWAYKNKLMVGISNQLFAPNDSVTGGMIVTVLARLAEADVTEYENETFADVYENEWYTPYAKWAKAIGLVEGIPFNPPKEISREWMGIIIERFLDYMDVDYEVTDEYIAFADADEISAEAMDALQKLYKIEIFRGKGDNIMDPQGNTTRAEFAALIQRTVNIMK